MLICFLKFLFLYIRLSIRYTYDTFMFFMIMCAGKEP